MIFAKMMDSEIGCYGRAIKDEIGTEFFRFILEFLFISAEAWRDS